MRRSQLNLPRRVLPKTHHHPTAALLQQMQVGKLTAFNFLNPEISVLRLADSPCKVNVLYSKAARSKVKQKAITVFSPHIVFVLAKYMNHI